MRILLIALTLIVGQNSISSAQVKDLTAKKILDRLYDKYQAAGSISAEFELQIESPESDENEYQLGRMIQQGDKHYVGLNDYEVYNNGQSLWVYLKDSEEVQWTSADSEDSEEQMPNLNDILTMYRSGDFDYAIVKDKKLSKSDKLIEFTPIDKDVEFFKMSMVISTEDYEPVVFRIFQKDGTKYTVDLNNVLFGRTFSSSVFDFDPAQYPNVHIEDLRID